MSGPFVCFSNRGFRQVLHFCMINLKVQVFLCVRLGVCFFFHIKKKSKILEI